MLLLLILILIAVLTSFICLSSRDRSVLFQSQKTLQFNNTNRTYLVSYPSSKTPKKLIIGLHAFGDSPRKFAYYTALHNSADNETIVVYPSAVKPTKQGIRPGWNSGFCCGSGWEDKADDTGFIEAIIKEFSTKYSINADHTFLVGFSNGSFMAERFAADKPERIGGIVVGSGTIGTTKTMLEPKVPMPILLMHGKKDKTVLFDGGATTNNPEFDWLPFSKTRSTWESVNGTFAPVKVLLFDNAGHSWNGWRILNFWNKRSNASNETVNFINSLNN